MKRALAATANSAVPRSAILAVRVPSSSRRGGASTPSHPARTAGNANRIAGASVSGLSPLDDTKPTIQINRNALTLAIAPRNSEPGGTSENEKKADGNLG